MKIRNIFNFLKEYKNIPFPISGNFNYKNIAIIGNSEILKKKSYGRVIDNFEFVIRFNRSPLIGFEKYVGSKTSLRVCGEGVFENQTYEVPGLEYTDEKANFIKNLNNSNRLKNEAINVLARPSIQKALRNESDASDDQDVHDIVEVDGIDSDEQQEGLINATLSEDLLRSVESRIKGRNNKRNWKGKNGKSKNAKKSKPSKN